MCLCRYWKCNIEGAKDGILKRKTVGVKDNVCVAGVPMMNGSKIMQGFVPDIDATVITKVLDAGKFLLRTSDTILRAVVFFNSLLLSDQNTYSVGVLYNLYINALTVFNSL